MVPWVSMLNIGCLHMCHCALVLLLFLFSHRVVEHSCKMVVRDSLSITYTQSSSYQPLYDDQDTFNLDKFVISLEIENKCQVRYFL